MKLNYKRFKKMVLICFYSLFNTGGVMPNSFPLLCDVTVFKSVNEIKMVMHILIKGFISPSTVSMEFPQQNTFWCKLFCN